MNEFYHRQFIKLNPLFQWADENKIRTRISSLENAYTMTTDYYIEAEVDAQWKTYWALKLS